MKPIDMLAEVLRRASLSNRERESFEDMWDRMHRSGGRCSHKQKAWIEKIYFGQKLDQPVPRRRVVIPTWQKNQEPKGSTKSSPATHPVQVSAPPLPEPTSRQVLVKKRPKTGTFAIASPAPGAPPPKSVPVGYINYPGVQQEVLVTNLTMFEAACPRISPGSRQYEKVANFFARGGIVLKVKPLSSAQVA